MKKILISGGTGLIGKSLCELLVKSGYKVIILSRNPGKAVVPEGVEVTGWDGKTTRSWDKLLDGSFAVINLAGESIGAGRWTPERKKRILDSRMDAGQAILEAIRNARSKPEVLLQASAIGFYGIHGDESLDENSPAGSDWLAGLATAWEQSTREAEILSVRRVILRTGLVLDKQAGVLPRLTLPFNFFIGGPLGKGNQWWSWISLQDQVRAMKFLLEKEDARGMFNLTAPSPVTMEQFGKTLGKVIHRPYWFPTLSFMLKLLLGEMSTLVLDGQRVLPRRLLDAGFDFRYPELESALVEVFQKQVYN
jgi:uncharacterized protein (TIGR01777 family)